MTRARGGIGRRRAVVAACIVAVGIPVISLLTASAAVASGPAFVRFASGANSSGTPGSTVPLTATLGSPCNTGDTLIAMVTVGEQVATAGEVSATPPGWQRLYEHAPSDTAPPTTISPYQAWFALPDCTGTTSVTFSITAPSDSNGTSGSLVLDEFSGLPDPLAVDFSTNAGSSSSSMSGSLTGQSPSSSGELVLSALSFYGGPPSAPPPSGWSAGGSETSTLPAYTYFETTSGSTPSANFSWSPSSAYEDTMLALEPGPAQPAPNVVQESQGTFSGQTSWSVSLPGVSAGDALVALVGTGDGSGSNGSGRFEVISMSGGGVTWQQVTGEAQSGNGSAEVWVGFGSTGSGSTTVTATMAASDSGNMVVSEVSGIVGVDRQSTNSGNSSSPGARSVTPQQGDFLVALVATNSTAITEHPVLPDWSTFSVSTATYGAEWLTNAPNTSSAPGWMTSPSGPWAAVQAAFDLAPPVVTGISPSLGPPAGGTAVTITGSNLAAVTGVSFGSTDASSFTVEGPTEISATAPGEPVGTVDVTVTTPQGTSATSPADEFTFTNRPAVTSVTPDTGPGSGGTSVTITGANFSGETAVDFGANPANHVVVSGGGTSITALSPVGTGTVNVTVTTPNGTSATSSSDLFTYTGGYWMVGSDGGVFAFGDATFKGSLPGDNIHVSDIVGVVPTADHGGYWMVGSDGGVFAFGDATFKGSLPGDGVHVSDIRAVVPTADGGGYWMIGADGGVFAFGDATFKGSLPGLHVKVSDIVGAVPTSDDGGYWMVGSDGGVFAFGDASFVGSLPGVKVHVTDVRAVVPTSDGGGYWMIGADGGVFAFGDAGFVGSLPGLHVTVSDIVGAVATQDGGGYWMVGADGGVFAFGDATFVGSLPQLGVHVDDIVGVVPA